MLKTLWIIIVVWNEVVCEDAFPSEVKLTDAEQKAVKDAFNSFDKKSEGKMKVSDIASAMKKLGHNIKTDWLEKMEDLIDEKGTGFITEEELIELIKYKMQEDEDERELKLIFQMLDNEDKGEVNVNELRWILKSLGDDLTEEDIDELISDVDTNGSGWVDYKEFMKLMLS